jgi:hypothetical protein
MESISIESAEASFHQWRVQRSSRAELTPEHLWNMALGLYPQYKRSKICRQLRLSRAQFKQRLDGFRPAWFEGRAPKCCLLVFAMEASKIGLGRSSTMSTL